MIIPFFLRNRGCPHRCAFCNERILAGKTPLLDEETFGETVRRFLCARPGPAGIAFYGGNFTGMAREEQETLLQWAAPFLGNGSVQGIRVSTRPDELDAAWLEQLQAKGVRAVEIGAQSMDDGVLAASGRGHGSHHVRAAVPLLKRMGFETGVHLMAGLPGDSRERFLSSVDEVAALRPHSVRIHPVLVLRGTALEKVCRDGAYEPLGLDEAVSWCKSALARFTRAGIRVARMGLQTTDEMLKEGNLVAGPFHPAFRSLVESALFFDMALALIRRAGGPESPLFRIAPQDVSYFQGPSSATRKRLA